MQKYKKRRDNSLVWLFDSPFILQPPENQVGNLSVVHLLEHEMAVAKEEEFQPRQCHFEISGSSRSSKILRSTMR